MLTMKVGVASLLSVSISAMVGVAYSLYISVPVKRVGVVIVSVSLSESGHTVSISS